MNERRVRSGGRQIYTTRPQPAMRPRRQSSRPKLSRMQWRVVVLMVFVLLVLFGLSQAFAVRKVTVQAPGNAASVQATAQSIVQSSFWSDNLLTFNSGALSSKLQQDDPAIKAVVVRRQWPHALVVAVTMQLPSLGWSTDGQEYLLDRDGSVIGPLPGGSTLPVVTDNSNLPVTDGKEVVSAVFVAFVQALVPALSANGYQVQGMSIQDTTYDLTVKTNKGYNLIFDTTRGVSSEIADLQAVQKVLVAQKQTPASYIDLRIAGKAYYE